MSLRSRASGWRAAATERRRLEAADRRSAMLGRLSSVQSVLTEAEGIVAKGWLQCAWYAGGTDGPAAACLVGAIVHAAGGRSDTEVAQKAIAVTWTTMLGREDDPDVCVAPAVRVARTRELTAWNDDPARTSDEVRALLRTGAARVEDARRRAMGATVHS